MNGLEGIGGKIYNSGEFRNVHWVWMLLLLFFWYWEVLVGGLWYFFFLPFSIQSVETKCVDEIFVGGNTMTRTKRLLQFIQLCRMIGILMRKFFFFASSLFSFWIEYIWIIVLYLIKRILCTTAKKARGNSEKGFSKVQIWMVLITKIGPFANVL